MVLLPPSQIATLSGLPADKKEKKKQWGEITILRLVFLLGEDFHRSARTVLLARKIRTIHCDLYPNQLFPQTVQLLWHKMNKSFDFLAACCPVVVYVIVNHVADSLRFHSRISRQLLSGGFRFVRRKRETDKAQGKNYDKDSNSTHGNFNYRLSWRFTPSRFFTKRRLHRTEEFERMAKHSLCKMLKLRDIFLVSVTIFRVMRN